MSDYEIIDTNAGNIDGCSLCGNKASHNPGRRRKADWLKQRYAEGLRYKVLRSEQWGDIGMIEYTPGQHAWRPVEAAGYLVIHCLWVKRQHAGNGLGSLLLDSCLRDAEASSCLGVTVVTSSGAFMARSDLFLKTGFVVVDRIPPYELLVKKLRRTAPDPCFTVAGGPFLKRYGKGLKILVADQCPYAAKTVERIAGASRALGLEPGIVRVGSARESRELPTPYGVFSILCDGKPVAGRPVSATRFARIMSARATG